MWYAVGEIVLVVLGILIALQINNWNEDRINRHKESELVDLLYKELGATRDHFQRRTQTLSDAIENHGALMLSYLQNNTSTVNIDSFSHAFMEIFYIGGLRPRITKFEQIITGEGFDHIQSDSLQLLLIDYKDQINLSINHDEKTSRHEILESLFKEDIVLHTLVQRGDHNWYDLFENQNSSTIKMDLVKLVSNQHFENIVVDRLMLLYSTRKRLERVVSHIEETQDYIERHYLKN